MISQLKKCIRALDSYSPYPLFYPFMMTQGEKKMFDSYLQSSKVYLEFGAGGTTIRALLKSNADIYCVESSEEWLRQMKSYTIIKNNLSARLHFHFADIGPTKEFGYPIETENPTIFENYTESVFDEFETSFPDTILVDGRFRVACVLSSVMASIKNKKAPTILIHDFWSRVHYHVVLKFLEVENRIDDLGVFRPKTDLSLDEIENYYKTYVGIAE